MNASILLRLEALERKLSKLNIRGLIHEIDPNLGSSGCVRVKYGDNQTSDWLPVKPLRSGKSSIWWFPEVGEGVTITDLETGEVLPGSFTSTNPPPSRDPDVLHIQLSKSEFITHNKSNGELNVNIEKKATLVIGGDCIVSSKGKVLLNSDAKDIQLNGGAGVVTGSHVCAYTGSPHSDCSTQVKAGK